MNTHTRLLKEFLCHAVVYDQCIHVIVMLKR